MPAAWGLACLDQAAVDHVVGAGDTGAAAVPLTQGLAQLFLGACTEPDVEQIILPDAPAVLGWEARRDQAGGYGVGLIQLALQSAMDAGSIVAQPVAPLAHVLVGAVNECALCAARAEDRSAARERCAAIFDRILRSIGSET